MENRASKPLHVEKDQAGFDLGKQLTMAVLFLVALILQQIYLPIGWEFDLNSPEFNPLVALPLILIGLICWNLGKAGWHFWHLKRFGAAFMELAVPAPLRHGSKCRGRVRTERRLNATCDYQITVRCVEGYRFHEYGEVRHVEYVTAWEETRTVDFLMADSSVGLPFEFELPMRGPLRPFIERAPIGNRTYFRGVAVIRIPFLKKKVITHNVKPDVRHWELEVAAPTAQGGFRAKFQVPTHEERD